MVKYRSSDMRRMFLYVGLLLMVFSFLAGCGKPNVPVGDYESTADDMEAIAALEEDIQMMSQLVYLKPKFVSDEIEVLEEDIKEDMKEVMKEDVKE